MQGGMRLTAICMKYSMIKRYLILILLLALTMAAALGLGAVSVGSVDSHTAGIIVGSIRLPRALGAALAGAALASAGVILQCVTANDLCAPGIIGINSGAGFALIVMLCFAPGLWQLLPLGAFIGALGATALIMGIAFCGGNKTKGTTIVLSGVAVSSILSAGISFLSLRYPDVLSSYTAFSVGGFSTVRIKELYIPSVIILIALIACQLISPKLNLLCLGDEMASSLGVRVKALRIIALTASASLCAAAVSFAGLLGFVGLIVPHIIRRIAGNDMRFNITLSALGGAVLTVISDTVGRILFAPSELPAGIIMSLMGAPFFLYLLIVRRHRHGRM